MFAQRYRDVEPVVRSCALQLFSTWMVACGNMFVTDKQVKYYGWMLNDTETKVRVESVKALNSVLLDEENVSKMEKFISIFHDRIIEMLNDPAAEVVVHVLELLETLLPHSVLCDEDLFLAEELVFINPDETTDPAGWGKVRTAAASFAMCYYDLLSGTAEGESEDVDEDTPDEVRLIGLIRFILDHARLSSNPNAEVEDDKSEDEQDLPPLISQTSDPDLWNNTQSLVLKQVPDLVRTFMHLDDGNFVTNWAAGGRLLQETGFENPTVAKFLGTTTELCDIEARVMVEILFASAKETLASTSNSTSSRRKSVTDRSALESRKAAFSAELVGFISQVLVGYQSDPVVVQGAANLVGLFQFDQLASSSHVKLLESIVGHLISVFKVQTEDGALVAIAKALNHFCNADHPIQRFAEFRLSRVYAIMSQRCDELVSLELVRSNTFRANLEMANNDVLAIVDQAEQAAVAKDTEYALSLALARLSTMERCIPLCSFKTMEETPDDHLSTIDLISLLQRRARDTKRLSGFVEAEEDTENSRYIRVCNLWQPSVYQHALEVAFARVLTQYQTILKQSTEADNVDGLNEQIAPALSLRDKLVTHLSDVCKRVPLRELGSDSIQVSELSDDTRQEIIAYESATDLALLKVYLDLRILATPRLREQDTAAGKLAWFPSRQVQSRFAKIFEHQISKHNTDRETLVLKLKEAGSNEMEVELAQMAAEAAFKHTTVLPWARAGMFADLGGSNTLSTSVSLMKAVSRDTTEVGSKTIQDITKEWKDLNPKRCMELHLRTLLSCTIDAKKNETENEGEEWEKVFGLAETLAQSLGTSSAQNEMAAVVEDFIGEGISVTLKPNGEHLLSLLHSLGYYVKHGGFLKKGARLRLLEKLDGLVRGLSEDVIVQINDARNSEEECDDDDLDIEALFEFEKLLAKGTGWKPQSRISVPGSRSAAVVEEEHNSENEAPEDIGGEAMSPSAVDTRSNSQTNAKTSISKTSAMDKARRARKSKLSLASDDENEEDENVTDNDSVPSTSSKRRKVEMERGEDPELTRMKSKAQKNVFESDSDDVSSSPNLRRRSRRTGTQRISTGRSSVATTAESDATSTRSSDDQRSSDDHTSTNGRKRTLRKSETSPPHSHKKQALSSENEDDEPGYATDATSISVIRPGRKSRRRR